MSALTAQVLDVDGAGLGDPRAEQPEQAGQGVINRPGCRRGLGEEGAEHHAVETEGRRLGVDLRTADVLGGRLGDEPSMTATR
jgi:hypothetical protein